MIPKAYFMLANAVLDFIDLTKDEEAFDEEFYVLWMLDVLSKPRCVKDLLFRVNPREHVEDTLPLAITSEKYQNRFKKNRILLHTQAVGYLRYGFEPFISVRKLKNFGLSKAHLLYAEYAKHVHEDNWVKSSISRKKDETRPPEKTPERDIQAQFSSRLTQEYQKGSASPNALEKLGKVTLDLETSDLFLPEEMGVKDVLNTAPKATSMKRKDTRELKNYIAHTLDSAGERYSALRRCGLDPNDWYSAPEPSITTLREFAKFIDELRLVQKKHPNNDIERSLAAVWLDNPLPSVETVDELLESDWGSLVIEKLFDYHPKYSVTEGIGKAAADFVKKVQFVENMLSELDIVNRNEKVIRRVIKDLESNDWVTKAEAKYLKLCSLEKMASTDCLNNKTFRKLFFKEKGEAKGETAKERSEEIEAKFQTFEQLLSTKIAAFVQSEDDREKED